MPLTRKIMTMGKNSYGITLPKSWIRYFEAKYGKIDTVSIEVNGKLTIRPIIKEVQRNEDTKNNH